MLGNILFVFSFCNDIHGLSQLCAPQVLHVVTPYISSSYFINALTKVLTLAATLWWQKVLIFWKGVWPIPPQILAETLKLDN